MTINDTAWDGSAHRPFGQVQHILEQYPLTAPAAHFVAQNAGVVYRVAADEGAFMLKLHQRVGEGENQTAEQIEAGMRWLAGMAERTNLVAQTPLRTNAGRYVCQASGERMVNATVQRWAEGRALNGDFTAAHLGLLGRTMAALHDDSAAHPPSTTAPASRHDVAALHAAVAVMREALVPELVPSHHFAILEHAAERIAATITALGTEPAVWGAVHGDIHQENVLIDGDDMRVIDWTPVRLAHYWYDLGVTMYHIYYQPASMRQVLLDSYVAARPAPANPIHLAETMLIYAALDSMAWNCTIAAQREARLFRKNLAQLLDVFCASLVADRTFLFVA